MVVVEKSNPKKERSVQKETVCLEILRDLHSWEVGAFHKTLGL